MGLGGLCGAVGAVLFRNKSPGKAANQEDVETGIGGHLLSEQRPERGGSTHTSDDESPERPPL